MGSGGLASIFNSRRPQRRDAVGAPRRAKPVDKTLLGYEQGLLFDEMENTNKSMFITGRAGTGKSFLLSFFIANSNKNVVVIAPTGIAALNVGGQTIHSFFKLPFSVPILEENLVPSASKRELYRRLDTIVIDEVSMVRADIMDAIDCILKEANDSSLPFGGKQMLLFGDLYQLPPVANPQVKRYLDDAYGGSFFFNAPAVKESGLLVRELTYVFRQKDPVFIDILNQVREGRISEDSLDLLNSRANVPVPTDEDEDGELAIVIAPTKDVVERTNEAMLESIDEPLFTYEAEIEGDFRETDFPTKRVLRLKVGARVMLLKNDANTYSDTPGEGRRWANGTLAQVSRLSEDSVWVMVNGVSHQLNRCVWSKRRYAYDPGKKELESRVTATFLQFPIALAWAITVHKAQGATYQSVGVDMGDGMFAEGQTYVALSRCVDMDHLYLTRPIGREDILTSNEVKEFMRTNGRE